MEESITLSITAPPMKIVPNKIKAEPSKAHLQAHTVVVHY